MKRGKTKTTIVERFASFFSFLLGLVLTGCTSFFYSAATIEPGTTVVQADATINGIRRTALVHIPRNFNPEISYPLVVVLHGAFSSAKKMEVETGFSSLADQEDFVVLYPNGMGLFSLLQHWNAGFCCGKAADDGLDDVGFIEECIEKVAARVNLDRKRIYITGFSNGGMLAYRYASEKSDSIAAIAALGASIGGRKDKKSRVEMVSPPKIPVPAMIVHGLNDQTVPAEGGISPKKGGSRSYMSLEDSTAFWLKADGCSGEPINQTFAHGKVQQYLWQNCQGQSSVFLVTIKGWGHRWPGPYFIKKDSSLSGFNITSLMWEFFSQHSR